MTDFESSFIDKMLEELRKLEVHIAKELGEIRATIEKNGERASAEHKSLKETVERNIEIDTHRLNEHSKEIDDIRHRIIKLEEFKETQKEKEAAIERKITNRIAFFAGAAAILAAIIAAVLDKL